MGPQLRSPNFWDNFKWSKKFSSFSLFLPSLTNNYIWDSLFGLVLQCCPGSAVECSNCLSVRPSYVAWLVFDAARYMKITWKPEPCIHFPDQTQWTAILRWLSEGLLRVKNFHWNFTRFLRSMWVTKSNAMVFRHSSRHKIPVPRVHMFFDALKIDWWGHCSTKNLPVHHQPQQHFILKIGSHFETLVPRSNAKFDFQSIQSKSHWRIPPNRSGHTQCKISPRPSFMARFSLIGGDQVG